MKNKVKSIFNRKDLKVLSRKETQKVKGGNATSGANSDQTGSSDFVIEEIIQI
ncbi:MAG: hypothetical protein ACJATF_003736 [Flavobacteriales bacterium]|jgi:hypothetical protein